MKEDRITTIFEYIREHPTNNSDLFTLWHETEDEDFLKIIQTAGDRSIIVYHLRVDGGLCDPPIHWKYGKKTNTFTK